jgi:hypothetical protein
MFKYTEPINKLHLMHREGHHHSLPNPAPHLLWEKVLKKPIGVFLAGKVSVDGSTLPQTRCPWPTPDHDKSPILHTTHEIPEQSRLTLNVKPKRIKWQQQRTIASKKMLLRTIAKGEGVW